MASAKLSYLDLPPIGYRLDGRPIYPMMGAEDDPAAQAAAQAAQAAAAAAASTKAAADAAAAAKGQTVIAGEVYNFPANTPTAEMTAGQQTEYWRHKARVHEDRNKAYGGLTAEQVTELRDKALKHDALQLELGTTADKAAAKAGEDAKAAARSEYLPAVIAAKLEAAAARAGVSDDDLAKAAEFVDTAKFLDANGHVDTDKVKAFVSTIAPAKGNQQQQKGPTVTGHGSSSTNSSGAATALTGTELYALRHPKKTSA